MEKVCSRFDEVESSFNTMSKNILRESELVKSVETTFLDIEKQIGEVASVSEENSASTEEIFAEIEQQNSRIIDIQRSIAEIEALCKELKTMHM